MLCRPVVTPRTQRQICQPSDTIWRLRGGRPGPRGLESACYHPAHAKTGNSVRRRARHGLDRGLGPGPSHRLERRGRRDSASLPGDRPDRLDRSADDPAWHREARRGLPPHRVGEGGHRHPDRGPRSQPPQSGGAPQGVRGEAAAPADGPHRYRQHRPQEVVAAAVQRHPPGRLHLRPRHRRRQGQRGRHGDDVAVAQAAEHCARPRRGRALRGWRRGRRALRHRAHDRRCALPDDRRRVLPRRRRQLQPPRREGDLRLDPDAREDPPRDHADGARHGRPRIGAPAVERRGQALDRGVDSGEVEAADQLQRDHRRLLQASGDHHRTRAIRRRRTPPTSTSSITSRVTPPRSGPRFRRR
jgi:hypothetical protein